ncbi:isocitrate lyase/PEP mutase family protein (plasmid) [Nicoliella spurrieriana]|uniref:Isocitrate lyase/PEP mutase family protein n=1 Tax=Nicoliella spurrieriana TaxID=2925830 RepID=A0A976X4K2_9LACO|nr:isocitrate lyase/PEP mutase family protein [Nicoliella spurrieriana]UQS85949.1 isocitrate lyase/PEP mutase family protein [Nicoliella spurrieriana]
MRNYNQQRNEFQRLINDHQILSMAVAPDALSAKIAEQVGFKAIFVAGYATAASSRSLPDRGILDFGEMLSKLREIIAAVNIPVFVDGDTGYGDCENVARTIRAYESAGAAGIFLEDQVWPKRCGHMAGKSVVPASELIAKIETAVATRRHANFTIMSRTDARQVYGLENAIERSRSYQAAGADMIFIEAPKSTAELETIAKAFPNTPLMANMIEDGATPMTSVNELEEMGYSMVVHPTALTYAHAYADRDFLTELYQLGKTEQTKEHMVTFNDFNQFVGLDKLNQIEHEYSKAPMQAMIDQMLNQQIKL